MMCDSGHDVLLFLIWDLFSASLSIEVSNDLRRLYEKELDGLYDSSFASFTF